MANREYYTAEAFEITLTRSHTNMVTHKSKWGSATMIHHELILTPLGKFKRAVDFHRKEPNSAPQS